MGFYFVRRSRRSLQGRRKEFQFKVQRIDCPSNSESSVPSVSRTMTHSWLTVKRRIMRKSNHGSNPSWPSRRRRQTTRPKRKWHGQAWTRKRRMRVWWPLCTRILLVLEGLRPKCGLGCCPHGRESSHCQRNSRVESMCGRGSSQVKPSSDISTTSRKLPSTQINIKRFIFPGGIHRIQGPRHQRPIGKRHSWREEGVLSPLSLKNICFIKTWK